jgi:hypothetical protein
LANFTNELKATLSTASNGLAIIQIGYP